MGLNDRDYTRQDYQSHHHQMPQMRFNFPKLTPAVKWLLIINVAVFMVSAIIRPVAALIYTWFQLDASSLFRALQLWRVITYQFLHDPQYVFHLFFNMLGLFFLGPTLERTWGTKKFLVFYLICGAAGGFFYLLLVGIGFLNPLPMVGASGAILGLLAACAIKFPQFVVFILLFPVPIRVAAVGLTFVYVFSIFTHAENAGGDAAHLAGMAAGAVYVFTEQWRAGLKMKFQTKNWEKKRSDDRLMQFELDRILKKVHEQGIHSLTPKEKNILQKATKQKQMQNSL
ncbi:MAG: rhomboid family intramembrane serine protease [Planctomycetota bacterium]|jgi:membrane associated rhomboid family serine protease